MQPLNFRPGIAWLRATAAALFVTVTAGDAFAQPAFTASVGGLFDSFTPLASAAESRQNLNGSLNLEHVFADNRGRVFYDFGAGDFDSPGDWSYFEHRGGFTYQLGGTEAQSRKLFANGSFVSRSNGEAWTTAAYVGLGGGLNAEFHPHDSTTLKSGYRADYRRFGDFTALTQVEQRLFASVQRTFESRTTLVAEIQGGLKHYDGAVVSTGVTTTDVTGTPAVQGFGRGMGPGMRVVTHTTYSSADADGSARMVSGLARLAQSITDRTGIHAQVTARRTFGSVPPALVTTPAGFFEDGVYDDPFASDALFLSAGIKRSFANSAEVAATTWWADKHFTSALALDAEGLALAGSPLRADRVSLTQVSWSQPLFPSRTGAISVQAELGYRFLRQRSNDAFYNYTTHAVGIGLTVGY